MPFRSPLQACLLVLALSATACAAPPPSSESSPQAPEASASGNLLANPGFEEGREPWTKMGGSVWGAFEIVDEPARTGSKAALLPVSWESGQPGQPVKVYGVVQEPSPAELPERLSGWYRVGDWWSESPETKLYVQVVVIVWDDPKTPDLVKLRSKLPIKNYQIRYYLAGVTQPPFTLANAKYRFVGRKGAPLRGEWVRFDIDLRRDFEELWGHLPRDFSSLRVLFEARWDGKPEGAGVRAEVYYDDLYLGDAPKADSVR